MLGPYALFLPLLGTMHGLMVQSGEIRPTLAGQAGAWLALTEGSGKVAWSGSGQTTEVILTPAGGRVGILARLDPRPTGLLDVNLSFQTEGSTRLEVQFTKTPDTLPLEALWTPGASAGSRQHAAARLAPPAEGGQPLYLCLSARGQGTVRVAELTLIHEPVLPRVSEPTADEGSEVPSPEATLNAQERQIAGTTELLVNLNGLQVSVDRETACTLGQFSPLSAFVEMRGTGTRSLTISGEFPEGVICDPRTDTLSEAGTHRAQLRLQGVLPGVYEGRLRVSSGNEHTALPVRVTVSRGYPAFGAAVAHKPGPYQWQVRELRVQASPQSTAQELLNQVTPFLEGQAAIPAIFFDGLPSQEVLREFVAALRGQVGLYSAAWRPDRPYRGDAVQAEAQALFDQVRTMYSVVSTTDLDAACVSPVFDWTANVEGSAENRLVDACLALQMGRYCGGMVVTARPLPAGGVLGESANDRNRKEASEFWTRLDLAQYPTGVEVLMEKHDAAAPILTSGIGGPASTDERLDGLKVARAMALAAYAGATGATFAETSGGDQIALTRPDGTLSAAGVVVRELSRELAGAVPTLRSWSKGDVPGSFGDPIVAVPFVRGDEVVLILWNNTSTTAALTLTLRQVPISEHRLTISRDDPFVTRTYEPHFEFSPQAIKAKRQEVYVRVAPLSVQVLRYRMEVPIPTWLDSVAFTAPPKPAPQQPERDDRPWWKKLQDWAEGVE